MSLPIKQKNLFNIYLSISTEGNWVTQCALYGIMIVELNNLKSKIHNNSLSLYNP